MSKPLRNERLIVPVVVWEKKQVDRKAKEANLNTSDYIRSRLGLTKARKTRNTKAREALENPQGDPDNAVDVEELARGLWSSMRSEGPGDRKPWTMAEARREAKRRLTETPQT